MSVADDSALTWTLTVGSTTLAVWDTALVLVAALGAELNDARTAGIFSAAIDWPSRALFALAFLTS